MTLELLPWESGLILGLSHVHRLKTWPRGLRIHPLSPEVCGDRSGRGHRNRRNRLDVRAPLNLASANAFLLSEHDLHLACAIASGLCDPVLPNCSHPRDIGHILVPLPEMPCLLLGTPNPFFKTQVRCFPSPVFHNSPSLTSPRAPVTRSYHARV